MFLSHVPVQVVHASTPNTSFTNGTNELHLLVRSLAMTEKVSRSAEAPGTSRDATSMLLDMAPHVLPVSDQLQCVAWSRYKHTDLSCFASPLKFPQNGQWPGVDDLSEPKWSLRLILLVARGDGALEDQLDVLIRLLIPSPCSKKVSVMPVVLD